MNGRAVCVHGHFYQPDRTHPWLGTVEPEPSAAPASDWNVRITDECYRPNSAARILDDSGAISDIVNIYGRISWNAGPSLLAWLAEHAPDVHEAMIAGDRESIERHGYGSAMAQPYVHAILPLANPRDRDTLVAWGVADFISRFGRAPDGMWLPETAADVASLDVLARHGIRFTVLSPHQASRVRPLGATEWTDVVGGRVDPTRTYLVRLPEGRSIAAFCYDGPLSQAVAFEHLLESGSRFEARLREVALDGPEPRLVHIATDGESYGHHHRFGEMALADALALLDAGGAVRTTNYAEWLATNPPIARARDHRPERLELRARCRTLAERLRLRHRRRGGLESVLARAAAGSA